MRHPPTCKIDQRKLYSEFKCSSLFNYCVSILGYSESSAQRRIGAARLLAHIPEIESKIEKGILTLSNIGQANRFFKENHVEKTEEKIIILSQIEDLTKRECEKVLFEISGEEKPARETTKRISENKIKVSIILSDETQAEVEKLKALIGKNLSMDELIKFMAKTAIAKVEKDKFKQVVKPRTPSPEKLERRMPSAEIKREVYKRDKNCTKCGSLFRLNFDHREAFALGGESGLANIRLLCFHCNQRGRVNMKL